jgi:hypothetical protein
MIAVFGSNRSQKYLQDRSQALYEDMSESEHIE